MLPYPYCALDGFPSLTPRLELSRITLSHHPRVKGRIRALLIEKRRPLDREGSS